MVARRRARVLAVGLVLLVRMMLPASAAVCGDANGNGMVDAGDGTLLLQYVTGLAPTVCGGVGALDCLDLRGDGMVDVADLVILLNLIAGNPTLFVCTDFDAVAAPCGASLSGNLTQNTYLSACTYFLDGMVQVGPGVVLTIAPGATMRARSRLDGRHAVHRGFWAGSH